MNGIRPLLAVVTISSVFTDNFDKKLNSGCHDVSPEIKGKSQQCVYYVCMEN